MRGVVIAVRLVFSGVENSCVYHPICLHSVFVVVLICRYVPQLPQMLS